MTPRPTGAEREFPGPILGGDITVPSSRELRRARRRRRRPLERVLRVAVVVTAALVLLVALGADTHAEQALEETFAHS